MLLIENINTSKTSATSVRSRKQRINQTAARGCQVGQPSAADSQISVAGFLSGPEESGHSLSNWITGLLLISKGCELSRGLA